ncbi:unnamed protein product [Paramecium octaurelia]|uniref:Uncharacterized protein n=1 Tax=Paramecium octaurelia TaxID=43137 RepID=A0A8S1U6Q3_PAROT|nr:unnamed protein product [Paramecium octaurelia]
MTHYLQLYINDNSWNLKESQVPLDFLQVLQKQIPQSWHKIIITINNHRQKKYNFTESTYKLNLHIINQFQTLGKCV